MVSRLPGDFMARGPKLFVSVSVLHNPTGFCLTPGSGENVQAVLGQSVKAILNASVRVVIGEEGECQLLKLLANQQTDRNPLYFLTIPVILDAGGVVHDLDVTAHSVDGVVILEFESPRDANGSVPDYYKIATKTVARLQAAASLLELCEFAAQEIRGLTGIDRVMVYKFHEDSHGEIFAESKRSDLAPWVGMHFPAEDIPKPARDVFTKTWLRPIPDMSDALAEMVPLLNPETHHPLDMTYCFLRGVSKMCTEYYRNMGVAATLTMSIRRGDHLWGLISCTHYTGPRYISYQVRAACEFLAQVVSLQHNVAEDKENVAIRLKADRAHKLLINAARDGGLDALAHGKLWLLEGIDASGAAMFRNDRWHRVGKTPSAKQLDELSDWLKRIKGLSNTQPLYVTACLANDYPAAAVFANVASGLMALQFSRRQPDLILWFKPETMQTVTWAGNPHDKPVVLGPNGPRLTPRASFELFIESVSGRSLPWKKNELEAVAKLRFDLIETVVARTEQNTKLGYELSRSGEELDAFKYIANRELKAPLQNIHRYAVQLMNETEQLDEKKRSKLDRMLRLTVRMDSLLDSLLHFSHSGKVGLTNEMVDINSVVAEAIAAVDCSESRQAEFLIPRLLPTTACNRGWCREIFGNLVSNALRYNQSAGKRIEIGSINPDEVHSRSGCPQGSDRHTIYYVSDNGIGIDPKYFSHIFKLFKRLHGQDDYGGGTGTGLTLVRKLVERHGGKVWLTSVLGKGTTFYFTLPHGEAT